MVSSSTKPIELPPQSAGCLVSFDFCVFLSIAVLTLVSITIYLRSFSQDLNPEIIHVLSDDNGNLIFFERLNIIHIMLFSFINIWDAIY